MIATEIARAAALLVVSVAARQRRLTIEIVYAVAFVAGSLSVLFELASLAHLPSLVGRARVFDGNSKIFLSEGFTGIAGRSLAGVLVRIAGAPVALLVGCSSFLLSAACLAAIRSPEPRPRRFTRTSHRAAIDEGLRFVFGNPILRITTICNGLWNVWYYARVAVLVLFLTEEGGLGPAGDRIGFGGR